MLPEIFKTYPSVYAVGDRYIVTVIVNRNCVMWVEVAGNCFYDHSNGILRSASLTHKCEVPMRLLDSERGYRVCYRVINERKPYFSDLGETESASFSFRPCTGKDGAFNIYHIADAHNRVDGPVRAGSYFGDRLDLLILNGDIPNHSGKIEYFDAIHMIAGSITKGGLPVIFSRGNHDTRGIFAENIADHTPTDRGLSYFTVRLGSIWAVVLDCAEDKPDGNPEYGHTICCHEFRLEETEFLKRIASDPDREFNAPGVKHRLVIVHNPFTEPRRQPFDIERDIYRNWAKILGDSVKPEIMISGHVHRCYVTMPGDPRDELGQPCPVIAASEISDDKSWFRGGAITLTDDECRVRFTDSSLEASEETIIPLSM
ncbi:MAG: metallophosphoesterase [Clostridia bacterium]|nr:metallophosphoesterase [Clostridia bacterium]